MKNITSSFKNIRLIPQNNKEYQKYCFNKKQEKKINKGETVPDKKMYVGKWLEKVIISELSEFHTFSEKNIIRWESVNSSQRIYTCFKELDGVMDLSNTSVATIEIKGSFSKSSIKDGLVQTKNAELLLKRVYKTVSQILIFADCRTIDSDFGYASSDVIDTLFEDKDFFISDNLIILKGEILEKKICIFLDEHEVSKFIQKYGNPYEDLIDRDFFKSQMDL
jgi:hypothetical protein